MKKIQTNTKQNHIYDEVSNSKMKNELNTSNKEIDKINDSIDDISQDFINKKLIDLSFLDVM